MKKDRKFVLNVAEEEVNVEDYRHNQKLTDEAQADAIADIEEFGHVQYENYKKYQCDLCNKRITWAFVFEHVKFKGEGLLAGMECATILDHDTNFSALQTQRQKHIKYLKDKFNRKSKEQDFKKEYPILYQAADYFKDYDGIIYDIFNKIHYGLTEKQIAYMTKLVLEVWEQRVAFYKSEFAPPKPPAPKLKAGVHELEVTISNYYYQEKGYYWIEKAVFETEAGQTIFTGKTKQLIQYLQVDLDLLEEDYGIEEFWKQDKKERKSWLTHDKVHFDKYTKGILKVELGDEFAEDKYGGKIVEFTPTILKEKKDYFNKV